MAPLLSRMFSCRTEAHTSAAHRASWVVTGEGEDIGYLLQIHCDFLGHCINHKYVQYFGQSGYFLTVWHSCYISHTYNVLCSFMSDC